MRVDGFVKVVLVVIAVLLAWSCVQNMGRDNGAGRAFSVVDALSEPAHAQPAITPAQYDGPVHKKVDTCGKKYFLTPFGAEFRPGTPPPDQTDAVAAKGCAPVLGGGAAGVDRL